MDITKEQLIEIAKIGFPERVKQFIDFENLEAMHITGVYRLYNKDSEFFGLFPKDEWMSISFDQKSGENDFVQIQVGNRAFNHYAAIKKMEEMKLFSTITPNCNGDLYIGILVGLMLSYAVLLLWRIFNL